MTLELAETWQPWHPSVRRGTWTPSPQDGEQPGVQVLAVLAPHTPSGVQRAKTRAKAALALRRPGVLALLDIQPHGRRVAFVYEAVEGIALANLTADRALNHRAAAELVGRLARILGDAELPAHPGPEPEDVLLCADATVRIANFVQPFPAMAPPRPPGSSGPEAALVYRLGALLAFLLGGPMPQSSTREAHEAAVRRAQIRAMSRPGTVFSEAYGNWLRAMLSWDPVERPPLSRVVAGIDELVATTAGASLQEECTAHFETWIAELQEGFSRDELPSPLPQTFQPLPDVAEPTVEALQPGFSDDDIETQPAAPGFDVLSPDDTGDETTTQDTHQTDGRPPKQAAGRRTLGEEHLLGDLDVEDDPTVDSELGTAPESDFTPPSIIERGSIPVAVGPPAEAIANRPSLPAGFLGGEVTQSGIDPTDPAPQHPDPGIAWPRWVFGVTIVLTLIACALGYWLIAG